MAIRFLTAGDSHGESLLGIVEGIPAGVPLRGSDIQAELSRRRRSYGRSSRQMIEKDEVFIVSGLWKGRTTGAPVGIVLPNRARVVQGKKGGAMGAVPRPGHADLAGVLKYGHADIPPVSERASARSTAMRVAVGAIAKKVLTELGVSTVGHVLAIGNVEVESPVGDVASIRRRARRSAVFCADTGGSKAMIEEIKRAKNEGNSLGGIAEVIVSGVVPGLGSHVEWDRKLDGRLAGAMMSIHSVKAVAIGDGMSTYRARGIDAHDAMAVENGRVIRETNRAGGIEGGMTNGEDIVVRVCAKPIPTAQRRAKTFNLKTLKATDSPYVRSDVCVIPALSVIVESVAAWEVLAAAMEKFGGDHIEETIAARNHHIERVTDRLQK